MKSLGAVRHKLKQVKYRHRKKVIEQRLARRPCNCAYNGVVGLPDGSEMAVCLFNVNSEAWNNVVCDEERGGLEQARECPFFEARYSPEEIKSEFSEFLRSADRAEIALHYPDVAALLWVLEEDGRPVLDDSGDDTDDTDEGLEFPPSEPVEEVPPQPELVEEVPPQPPVEEIPDLPVPRRATLWDWIKGVFGFTV